MLSNEYSGQATQALLGRMGLESLPCHILDITGRGLLETVELVARESLRGHVIIIDSMTDFSNEGRARAVDNMRVSARTLGQTFICLVHKESQVNARGLIDYGSLLTIKSDAVFEMLPDRRHFKVLKCRFHHLLPQGSIHP